VEDAVLTRLGGSEAWLQCERGFIEIATRAGIPMKVKVAQTITAVAAQYQSEPWLLMAMSTVLPFTVLPPGHRLASCFLLTDRGAFRTISGERVVGALVEERHCVVAKRINQRSREMKMAWAFGDGAMCARVFEGGEASVKVSGVMWDFVGFTFQQSKQESLRNRYLPYDDDARSGV